MLGYFFFMLGYFFFAIFRSWLIFFVFDGNEKLVFSNVAISKEYEEFLNFIGQRVKMQNFTGYAGGLDVKTNLTGEYSVATKCQGLKINK